jgi:HD-like signal output (HDOD) protein
MSVEAQSVQQLALAMESPNFRVPLLPKVAQDALALTEKEGVSLNDLGKLIERDQVLAARFLTAANSPLYNRGMPVLSVAVALTRLGLVTARDILVGAAMEPFFAQNKTFAQDLDRLRLHSLAVSAACNYLADVAKLRVEGAAGLLGLIHDLGALALYNCIADTPASFPVLIGDKRALTEALKQLHERAGQILATRWKLPDELCQTMAQHHKLTPNSSIVIKLVAAGDALASRCGAQVLFDAPDPRSIEALLGKSSSVTQVVTEFTRRIADVKKAAS